MSLPLDTLNQQAQTAMAQAHYAEAILLYGQLVEMEPDTISHAWLLGLAYLLSGDEAEAQLTWMMAMATAAPEQIEAWTEDLAELLQTAATQQETAAAWNLAWAIRQHLREISPDELPNLLHLVQLALRFHCSDAQCLVDWGITSRLQSQPLFNLDQTWLLDTLFQSLEQWFGDPRVKDFAEAILGQWEQLPLEVQAEVRPDLQPVLAAWMDKASALSKSGMAHQTQLAVYLAEICLRYDPKNLEALRLLAIYYETTQQYNASVAAAQRFRDACQSLDEQMVGNAFLMARMLRTGQYWQEATELFHQQERLAERLIQQYVPHLEHSLIISILNACYAHAYYLKDDPARHHRLQNQLATLFQADLQTHALPLPPSLPPQTLNISTERKLRIGYIGHTMRQHSVGWLARWLMQHHNQERFEIYTYHVHVKDKADAFTQQWFIQPVSHTVQFEKSSCVEIAKRIREDQIDILVELDSITYDHTCGVMALKPAPVQVSWLGFDASGLPAIDYFMADPYVLPESAQDYYQEKIWRLPSTYLAVDGFEIGIPTLRREDLGIPPDAIVYLSAQSAQKRFPTTARLQIKILREVPNSYLFIKGFSEEAALKQAFLHLAESEGVVRDRLRFLGLDSHETTHRANLGIADVVLDTYPYNGATTTLETLWMGIPLVTRVGQQWAARNSYTMLKNVGVEEGIAWTDEEYLEWGIRLGKDRALRQDIHIRLMQSRQTSPLWNTQQFARDLEAAYEQMWQIYVESHPALPGMDAP